MYIIYFPEKSYLVDKQSMKIPAFGAPVLMENCETIVYKYTHHSMYIRHIDI